MRAPYLLCLPLLLAPGAASAAHCGHGQIYRVHLRTCVSAQSALARVAFHRDHHDVKFADLPRRHYRHHIAPIMGNDPADPIEDRVIEPPVPPAPVQTSNATPSDPTPATTTPLPDPFGKSVMSGSRVNQWRR
jgi:hypothetical protein